VVNGTKPHVFTPWILEAVRDQTVSRSGSALTFSKFLLEFRQSIRNFADRGRNSSALAARSLQQRTRPDNIRRMKPWPCTSSRENGGKWNLLTVVRH